MLSDYSFSFSNAQLILARRSDYSFIILHFAIQNACAARTLRTWNECTVIPHIPFRFDSFSFFCLQKKRRYTYCVRTHANPCCRQFRWKWFLCVQRRRRTCWTRIMMMMMCSAARWMIINMNKMRRLSFRLPMFASKPPKRRTRLLNA